MRASAPEIAVPPSLVARPEHRPPAPVGRWNAARMVEAAVLVAVVAAVSWEAFYVTHRVDHAHEYLLAPLAAWAALRFGIAGASALTVVLAGFAVAATSGGFGLGGEVADMARRGPLEGILFIGTLGATSLVLAALTRQSRRARAEAEGAAARAKELVEELDRFMRHAPLPVFVRDPSGRFVAVSNAYGELVGRAARDIVGRPMEDVWDAELAAELRREDARALAEGGVVRGELEHRGRFFATIRFPLGSAGRERVGGYVVDVTERKQAERALRLASVGALASGVAHEVNNPLSFLTSNLSYVADEIRDLEREVAAGRLVDVRAAVDDALHGADRVRRIVRDLRQISTHEREAAHPFDPREAVGTALELMRGRLQAHGELEEHVGPVPLVVGSESELSEALVNVLVNAVEARLPAKGLPALGNELEPSIPRRGRARHVVRVSTGTDPAGRAAIEVADTGRGIAPDDLPRIFDPFYTTKEPGAGTGLGLSVAHGIVTRMGGGIDVRSAPGSGTTVRILLPAAVAVEGPAVCGGDPPEAPPRSRARAVQRA